MRYLADWGLNLWQTTPPLLAAVWVLGLGLALYALLGCAWTGC